jgi:hypothetical protein
MVVPPGETPVTFPEPSTVAADVLVLVQLPPAALGVSDMEEPTHTTDSPDNVPATGAGLTVIGAVVVSAEHADDVIYVMVVLPAVTPVTTPPADMVAIAMLPLLHTPPPVLAVKVVVAPGQTDDAPLITPATAGLLTVIDAVAEALPQALETV